MTDKYEEFKEWIGKMEKESIAVHQIDWERLFITFEEEQAEKQHKQEIMDIIWETLMEHTLTIKYSVDGIHLHPAEAVYNKLKEKDLIK